ncbi:MAG: hypothetical protein AABY75_08820 [Bacteroidota bacterium]
MNPTEEFLVALEDEGKRPLNQREALGMLLDRAAEGMEQAFLDACFHAKFLVRAQEVMRRIGRDGEGFDKMSAEFQAGVGRTTTLLRTMVKDAPELLKDRITKEYLQLQPDVLQRFLGLCADLARVKNWEVDGRPMPFGSAHRTPAASSASPTRSDVMKNLLRASRLALLLFILLLVLEGPVTILGWITAFLIVGLFIVVEVEAAHVPRQPGA